MKIIDKVALILLSDENNNFTTTKGQLLVARSQGKKLFYLPGGKREPGETDIQTLLREIQEELNTNIPHNTIQYANTFEAPADGKKHTFVRITCYYAHVDTPPQASNEIVELQWVSLDDKHTCSVATQMIMDWLYTQGKIQAPATTPSIGIGTMNDYEWVVFDADNTLFRFLDFTGLQRMFDKEWNMTFTHAHYDEYKELNLQLWKAYENGAITAEQLRNDRFKQWAKTLNTTSEKLNIQFLDAMAIVCPPLPGAESLLSALHKKAKLAIITNGFTSMQKVRLDKNKLSNYIDFVLSSEAAGAAKPNKEIFEQALQMMGNPHPSKVLMVGDNPESDIKGAKRLGMATCLLDESNSASPLDLACQSDHAVSSLPQLLDTLERTPPQNESINSHERT